MKAFWLELFQDCLPWRITITDSLSSSSSQQTHHSHLTEYLASPGVGEYGSMEASYESVDARTGSDMVFCEPFICQRLTEQILAVSSEKATFDGVHGELVYSGSLEEALRDAADTIRFHAKWFAEAPLATLLQTALNAAARSSASADLYAAMTLIDTVGTYSLIPPQGLEQVVRFISQTYYGATRAYKTRKLSDETWITLQHILESHLGGQCVVVLLDIVSCRDISHLESKAGHAQVAGALIIISEKMLLRDDVRHTVPTPGLTQLLDSLWGAAVNGSDYMRELIMDITAIIIADDNAITELDAQDSWDALLETLEPCIALSPNCQAASSVVEALILCIDHFESRHLPTISQLVVDVDLPLTNLLAGEMLEPWEDIMPSRDLPNEFLSLVKKLCKSVHYLPQLSALLDRSIVKVFMWTPERAALAIFVREFQDIATDPSTPTETANELARALASMFVHSVGFNGKDWERNTLFDALCKISYRCMAAAETLFNIRADVEGSVYFESVHPATSSKSNSSSGTALVHYLPSLPMWKWDEALLDVVRNPPDWTLYHYFLTALPALLSNHTMFEGRIDVIKQLKEIICPLLDSGDHAEPPANSGLAKSQVTVALTQILMGVLSYHRWLSKQDIVQMTSVFLNVAGSRDYAVSIPCVHALTICCYELPEFMSSYMDDIIDKMSKIVTQRYLAIHVLLFLAGLSRQPELFRNFQTHDYKKIFGVCGSYLQSIRGTSALLERRVTPSSDSGSRRSLESADALPQYVYALAHHVIAFWYLALKSHDRRGLKEYITSCLKYKNPDGQQVIEDQGLVTMDLMDRVDAEEADLDSEGAFDSTDGRTITLHRLAGLLLITTETALRTAKTVVTIRRPTGTGIWTIQKPMKNSALGTSSVAVTVEGTEKDYICVFPFDSEGCTYGRVYTPTPESTLGSNATVTLPSDDAVTRAIQSLDRTSALDSHKAGVIYVGESQTTEAEILLNAMGSPDYVEFMMNLGRLARLRDAKFNTQGLDRVNDTDGQHAVVWHNQVTELVFHVTTLMPNNEDVSLNTANKKRHIGNNHVNIIFNNSGSPFKFDTFPSQFNSVYIVIAPSARTSFLQTRERHAIEGDREHRFYTVKVLTRPGYPSISSAAEEKVISGASLPGYVRNLALNECIFSLMWEHQAEPGEYPSSWRSRLMQIRRLRERYAVEGC